MGELLALVLVLFLWDYTRGAVIGFICWMGAALLILAGIVGTLAFGMVVFYAMNGGPVWAAP